MSPNADGATDASRPSPSDLPSDLVELLAGLDESELRATISYAQSLLPDPPTVADLLEASAGDEIIDVEEASGYTKVVKTQSCVHGCDDCPHGPYLYHVRVEKRPEDGVEPSLHWEFIGPVR